MTSNLVLKFKSFVVKIFFLDWFYFVYICFKYKLSLKYLDNKQGVHILREVFSKNAYSSFFPFDREAIILDIGSHYGFFAIFANLHLKKNSKIYCFEPSSSNFDVLSNNLQSVQSNKIQFYQLAIAGNSTERLLALSKPQNHSLYPEYITTSTESELVNSISLEDFITANGIQNIDFLKMDCEGSEYEILLNASPLTLEKIDVISMEVHDNI